MTETRKYEFYFKKENIYPFDEVFEHLEVDITKLIEDCNNNRIKARKNCNKYFLTGENLYRYFHYLNGMFMSYNIEN